MNRFYRTLKNSGNASVAAACGLLVFMLAAAYGMSTGTKGPDSHDEFAYLLAGETFARGRLTNPRHAMWQHFETFHVLQVPTYQAKYPPGQGLLLAAGELLGHPIIGVWLGVGLLAGCCLWALQGALRRRWAVFATSILVLNVGIVGYWAQAYWGGALAASGGALLFGAVVRLFPRDRGPRPVVAPSLVGAIALGILANTRPQEGLVLALVVLMWALQQLRRDLWVRQSLHRLLGASMLVIIPTGLWMGYYNWRVTDSPFTLPYQVYESTYAQAPNLLTSAPFPEAALPKYRHRVIAQYHSSWGRRRHQLLRSDPLPSRLEAVVAGSSFLLGPALVLLLLVPFLRGSITALAMLSCAAVASITLISMGGYVHYYAPVAVPTLYLIGAAASKFARRGWRAWVLAGAILCLTLFNTVARGWKEAQPSDAWSTRRSELARRLTRDPALDLVVVDYGDTHNVHHEWVYNSADIDESAIVWARRMDPENDSLLVDYFRGRNVWLLHADADSIERIDVE